MGKIPEQDEAFSRMVNTARMLVIDHDINRYHSYELYSFLLKDKKYFMDSNDRNFLVDFVNLPTANKKLTHYLSKSPYYNPFHHFNSTKELPDEKYEDYLNNVFSEIPLFSTDISYRFSTLFYNKTVQGYLLKYSNDNHKCGYEDQVKVFTSHHLLDGVFAARLITKFQINAVIVASIDVALNIQAMLHKLEYKTPMNYYIGIYRYNFDPETRTMKNGPIIAGLEYSETHSFITIDPFTNLSYDKESQYDVYEEGN